MTKKELEDEYGGGKIFLILIPIAMILLAGLCYGLIWFLLSLI